MFMLIPSMRKSLSRQVNSIASKWWKNAAFAHLTALYHASQNNFQKIWTIDADDTAICESPTRVADMMRNAMNLAERNNYEGFSLDMWRSRTHGVHWSLGVVYFRDTNKICSEIDKIANKSWFDNYKIYAAASNVDWLFNHFKDTKKLRIESFYFENAYFIHWGNFIWNPIVSYYCYWGNGKVYFPIWESIFQHHSFAEIPIADVIKIESSFTLTRSQNFVNNEMNRLKFHDKGDRQMLKLGDFGMNSTL